MCVCLRAVCCTWRLPFKSVHPHSVLIVMPGVELCALSVHLASLTPVLAPFFLLVLLLFLLLSFLLSVHESEKGQREAATALIKQMRRSTPLIDEGEGDMSMFTRQNCLSV